MSDYVTGLMADWAREHPGLDTSPMAVVNRILRAGPLLQGLVDPIANAHGLSRKGDLDVLTALRRTGEPYERTPSWLARAVQLTTGGMTNRLDRLEVAGLVTRRPDPSDRRGVLVRLTAHGRAVVDSTLEEALVEQARAIASLTAEERTMLAASLERLLVGLGDRAESSALLAG